MKVSDVRPSVVRSSVNMKKYEKGQTISTENCHFYSHEKSLYVAWACFRNGFCFPGQLNEKAPRTISDINLYSSI